MIFICLQAKLQLLQEYTALFFEIVFAVVRKKLVLFKLNDCSKNFDVSKQEKSLYSGGENRKLNTVANMVAKIDIDALNLKLKKKNQEQMILKIGKILKTACVNSRVTGSKKEQCTSTCSHLKNLKPIGAVNSA